MTIKKGKENIAVQKRRSGRTVDIAAKPKVMLVILDGWGLRSVHRANAPYVANTPTMDMICEKYPYTELLAAEEAVGLPKGFIGNSEVGHIHLGAGKLINQDLMRINTSIKDKSFFKNKAILRAMWHAVKKKSTLHLMGLMSDGGVHSHIDHLFALLQMAKNEHVPEVHVHCFLDGRDVEQKSAARYLARISEWIEKNRYGEIKTVMGRFYAMDRDNRWNREHKAYAAMAANAGLHYKTWQDALHAAYARGETDEFVQPCVIDNKDVDPSVSKDDAIIFFNFRSDRAREITRAFVKGQFNKFKRKKILDLVFVTLTQYDKKIHTPVAFPPRTPGLNMGQIMQDKGMLQMRIAETEKYAHVTYFFNSGRERPYKNEHRILVPSPHIRTYDLKPEMSATLVTKKALDVIKQLKYDLIVLNFANSDMVGHTGMMKQTVDACAHVDGCLGQIVAACQSAGYHLIVTADHGNAEEMEGIHRTTHTLNQVPCILIPASQASGAHEFIHVALHKGTIAQITPTMLELFGIKPPKDMLPSLIVRK